MQVVILCGGKGTRLFPKTENIPKPLIQIGGKPILWYIMKTYSKHGHKDFILCLGYLGNKIKEYFQNPKNIEKDWKITFVNTGLNTKKGDRLRKIRNYIKEDNFLVAYGDDVSDVNINEIIDFHKQNGKIATLTAINPVYQFGLIRMNEEKEITGFEEKPKLEHWINGGYFVFNKKIFDHMEEGWDLEKETFESLVKKKELCAFEHSGFWKSMNTLKDSVELNELWKENKLSFLWSS